jgi:hypothetical protein
MKAFIVIRYLLTVVFILCIIRETGVFTGIGMGLIAATFEIINTSLNKISKIINEQQENADGE